MEVVVKMKDGEVNFNIENIYIENLILSGENLDLLKGLNIKTKKVTENKSNKNKPKIKDDLDNFEKIDNNKVEEDCGDIPYVPPRRLKAKRNFGDDNEEDK